MKLFNVRQRFINCREMRGWESEMSGPAVNRLGLSDGQIDALPSITEVVEWLKEYEARFREHGGWKPNDFDLSGLDGRKIRDPRRGFYNEASDDAFIMNRTASGRFNLQPNLHNKPFLYRGQNEVFPRVESGFDLLPHDNKLAANLRYAEFLHMVRSHPVMRMLEHGIWLDGLDEPIFFEVNYYGFAQHYGFKTGLTDFSSNVEVAAFFAVTKATGDDIYEIYDNPEVPYGVMYTWEIVPDVCFTFDSFRTVGRQYVPRCGIQRGFFHEQGRFDINGAPRLIGFPFRHDATEDRKIYGRWEGGRLLFLDDDFTAAAREILNAQAVGLRAFSYNKYVNPLDNVDDNMKRAGQAGLAIDANLQHVFTYDMLSGYYAKAFENWERFCDGIYIGPKDNHRKAVDSLRQLPHNPHYGQYFFSEYYDRLYYGQNYEEVKNGRKKV